MLAMRKERRSVRSVWQKVVEEGGVVSYETFIRWIQELLPEWVEESILKVGKGKRKRIYVVCDEEALIRKLEEQGYVF